MFTEDPTDSMYFMASVLRQTEQEMKLEIDAILLLQDIARQEHNNWINLMKVYLAVRALP